MAANSTSNPQDLCDRSKWTRQLHLSERRSNGYQTGGEDDQLLSMEKLRASPEIWPEQIPGVSEFASTKLPASNSESPPKWLADLEKDDIDLLQEFGSLTAAQLMEKVRGLQNLAYQLGLDEAREMTRGKFLNILEKPKSRF